MNDIASDLKERLDYAAYFYLSAWEHDPETVIDGNVIVRDEDKSDFEDQMIDTFEKLRDGVDAIPLAILAKAEELRVTIGSEKYEALVIEAIQGIGRCILPKDAAEFLELMMTNGPFAEPTLR